jgi:hypothetical protein
MPERDPATRVAHATYNAHKLKARQYVVDRMVEAIKAHDMPNAYFWESVGQIVDTLIERDGGTLPGR